MITQETARKIWSAYNEIEKTEELIVDVQKKLAQSGSAYEIDTHGNRRGLTLSVPTSSSGHSCYNVSPNIALDVLKAHLKDNRSRLISLMGQANAELQLKEQPYLAPISKCKNCESPNIIGEHIYRCKSCNCFHDKNGSQL